VTAPAKPSGLAVAGGLLLTLLFGCSNGDGTRATKTTRSPLVSVRTTNRPTFEFRIGDKVVAENGNTVQVFSYLQPITPPSPLMHPRTGTEFAAYETEICVATEPATVNALNFVLRMPDNTRFDAGGWIAKSPDLKATTLRQGDCVRGWVSSQVPVGQRPSFIVFSAPWLLEKWIVAPG
jgi:hypothetical protein